MNLNPKDIARIAELLDLLHDMLPNEDTSLMDEQELEAHKRDIASAKTFARIFRDMASQRQI